MPRKRPSFSPQQVEQWRAKIKVGKAIEVLNSIVDGTYKGELTTARMKAIEIALRKSLPDLSSIELSGGSEPIRFSWAPVAKDKP